MLVIGVRADATMGYRLSKPKSASPIRGHRNRAMGSWEQITTNPIQEHQCIRGGIEGGEGGWAVKVQQCSLVAPAVDPLGGTRVGQVMIVQRALAFSSIHHCEWAGEAVLKIERRDPDSHGSSSPC